MGALCNTRQGTARSAAFGSRWHQEAGHGCLPFAETDSTASETVRRKVARAFWVRRGDDYAVEFCSLMTPDFCDGLRM
jgi:hypothetical protein